ncbi:MAG: sulfite exporter TauE/SafE family protein [Chromatiales bacterium]|jgi:sulfite exporter TauE/SafE|nr:sulfite exporter TauE/SafE family protein [Chromatiales bacterium]MDX9767421.1 sulfite exporter TauE/SafE family protein [Ectothiorhodospiraceae bacterium]
MIEHGGYLAAFAVGLLGGVHCAGMCGGIVGALSLGLPGRARANMLSSLPFLLAYNGGRMASYVVAGAAAGGIGWFAANLASVHHAQLVLQTLAGLFMIALGLYLAGWWQGVARVERAGAQLWRRIEPFGRRLMPVTTPGRALRLGLIWGWLPCGLVYSVLIWALAAGGAVEGALLMLAFGLGTLPNLLAMGAFAARLAHFVRRPGVKATAGVLVMLYGCYMLWLAAGVSG